MKRKLLYTAVVATVMGTANPLQAAGYQDMYWYYYYDNGQLVGERRDKCTMSGVIGQGQWLYGYATSDVRVEPWIGCQDGQWVVS
jgi:hypothetical protein